MGPRIKNVAIRTAQDNDARPTFTVTGGQGGYVAIPDTRPAPQSYALTGEQSQYRKTLRDWQAQAGPVYSVGNARIVIAPTR
jgi:hypothetical protein